MPSCDGLSGLRGGLVVSCQAQPREPLHGAAHMAAMALAAVEGGAVGIRCESPADIAAIRAVVQVPLIGLWKRGEGGVYITPTFADAAAVVAAGADVVALDATARARPEPLPGLVARVTTELGVPVLADVSTLEEALAAEAAGAWAVAPTLAGYTGAGPVPPGPAWTLLQALVARCRCPVLMEGRIWTPEEASRALDLGAWAVVVGSAITRPQLITRRFTSRLAGTGTEG
ncbi:MAG: putative N-acetylmannosamine-6-phosphate 2-epimerase [Candidatus Sericytochromatia bacterium]|nr:putative N-acetylmannosamine-6-phosphate 2-epimerase [Candidatus Sericytochromatia bacterium]